MPKDEEVKQVDLSTVITQIEEGNVEKIVKEGDKLIVTLEGGEQVESKMDPNESLVTDYKVDPKSITIEYKEPADNSFWGDLLLTLLPFALIVGFFFFIIHGVKPYTGLYGCAK